MKSRFVFLVILVLISAVVALHSPRLLVAAETQQPAETQGVIKALDTAAGRVKIAHEPVKSLGWPAMTMDFEVADKAMLADLKPGQQVVFRLVARDGRYVIESIKPKR